MGYIHDCSTCKNKCDGHSRNNYIFQNDVEYGEMMERRVISAISAIDGYSASKCVDCEFPDVLVEHNGQRYHIEVKAQQRTFMTVKKELPQANLVPSDTMALNLSDLLRYFELREQTGEKMFILWTLQNRPCINGEDETLFFFQDVDDLKTLYRYYGYKRRFRRASGNGDIDENGEHRGVVVNYHFSLYELQRATEESGFSEIRKLFDLE